VRRSALISFFFVAALTGGCGGDESTTTTGNDAEEIRSLYVAYFDELGEGEGQAACDLLTDDYQDQVVTNAGGGHDCPEVVLGFAFLYGDSYREHRAVLETLKVSGDTATARDPGDPGLEPSFPPQRVEFERVDGEWRIAGIS
jgi:hypothetical protein